jgi:hypothetical protein
VRRARVSDVQDCKHLCIRMLPLRGTQVAKATAGTVRKRLLKIGAMVRSACAGVRSAGAGIPPSEPLYTSTSRSVALAPEQG